MYKETTIQEYLSRKEKVPLIDVRSPKEFLLAHIPGAISIPLFDDEERAIVGTLYKNEGTEHATEAGLVIAGKKIPDFLEQVKNAAPGKQIVVHCWRGGMRSKSMATLFAFSGFKTEVIRGGYKSYRHAVKEKFLQQFFFGVIGGKTGSAKTAVLKNLKMLGEQVIDLEALANHKGSAFGDLGEESQPSTEQFENLLFEELRNMDPEKRIWLEDESHKIGSVFIPEEFWEHMSDAELFYLDIPKEKRVEYLAETYGNYPSENVEASLLKIRKKLGGQHYNEALAAFHAGDLKKATEIVLVYYDKTYDYSLERRTRKTVHRITFPDTDAKLNAEEIYTLAKTPDQKMQYIS